MPRLELLRILIYQYGLVTACLLIPRAVPVDRTIRGPAYVGDVVVGQARVEKEANLLALVWAKLPVHH